MSVGRQSEKVEHRLAFLGEARLGLGLGDAFGCFLLARRLAVGLGLPQRRPADGVHDHQPERDARMAQKRVACGGMTVKLQIVLRWIGQLGPGV